MTSLMTTCWPIEMPAVRKEDKIIRRYFTLQNYKTFGTFPTTVNCLPGTAVKLFMEEMKFRTGGPTRVSLVTLGCEKNTVDSEILMGGLRHNGVRLVNDPSHSDIIILNTCGFIESAKRESINSILEAVEMKSSGSVKEVYVAGCLSER